MTKGWKLESARHSLARRGIETGRKIRYIKKIGKTLPWLNPKEVIGKKYTDVAKLFKTEADLDIYLEENELNTCDKCNKIDSTYDLVWITSPDFEPKEGEIVPQELYKKYDALCEDCYQESIKKVK